MGSRQHYSRWAAPQKRQHLELVGLFWSKGAAVGGGGLARVEWGRLSGDTKSLERIWALTGRCTERRHWGLPY